MSKGYMFYDDETANSQQLICELAYVLTDLDGAQIGEPVRQLVNPKAEFSPWNTRIHHIGPDDVLDAPTLDQFCSTSDFLQDLSEYTLVAHNAKGADIHHIRKSLAQYGISMPDIEFLDTRAMASTVLESRSLDAVCRHYGIPFEDHHSALPDALACRDIFFRMLEDGIAAEPEVSDGSVMPSRSRGAAVPITGQGRLHDSDVTIDEVMSEIEAKGLKGELSAFENLQGLPLVVTGTVPGYNRDAIQDELKLCGAAPKKSISGRTKLLVIGHNASRSKIDEAIERRIPVMTAGELLGLIDLQTLSEGSSAQDYKINVAARDNLLEGKSFSFATGLLTLDPFEGYQIVCKHGGIARQIRSNTSVQADTDYLVVTNDLAQGAKRAAYIDNAKSKGVEVISEDEFWDMVGIKLGPDGVADHWVLVDDYLEGGRVDVSNKPAWDGTVAPYKLFIQCRSAKSTHAGGWKVIACGFLEGTEEFKENVGAITRLPDGPVVMDTLNKETVPWGEWRNEIGKVIVNDRFAPKSCAYLFDGLQRCSEFDLNGLDTSGATSMRAMFRGCSSIDYFMATDRFDTSLVSDMWCMFFGCINARVINCIGWDLTQVTSMQMMFENSPAAVLFDDKNVPIPERIDTSRMFDTKPKEGRWLRRV